MVQIQSTPGADLEVLRYDSRPDVTPSREPNDPVGPTRRGRPRLTPDPTVSADDRLIARIETGTATPEDVDGLPDGVVEYLYAVLTLSEMDQDWEVTPTGGILVRCTGGQSLPTS